MHKLTDRHKELLATAANITGLFVVWRLAMQMMGFLATARFRLLAPTTSPWDPITTNMLQYWAKWDSGWYLTILRQGYSWISPDRQSNIAFFPLYPILTKIVSFPFELNYFVAGLIVSNLALLGALFYLFALVKQEFNRTVAYRTVLFVVIFPLAFFYNTFYTESLFLLTLVASFYHARRNQWWAVGLWGFAAATTRFVGVALLIPLIMEYLAQREWKFTKIRTSIGWLLLIPLGLASYMAYLKTHFANSLLFIAAESAWHRAYTSPWRLISETYWPLARHLSNYLDPIALAKILDFWYLIFYILAIIAIFLFLKKKSYGVLAVLLVLPALLSGTLESMPRYGMVIFPLYILLAVGARNIVLRSAYIIFATLLLAINIILFVNWQWVA